MNREEFNSILDIMYDLAKQSVSKKEVPVIASLILNDGQIFYSGNEVEKKEDPLSHAEINVINKAIKYTSNKYLDNATLIVTLEPCLMCMGAILKTHIKNLFYITEDTQEGSLSYYHLHLDNKMNINHIKDDRFDFILKDFFKSIRK